MWHYIQKRYRHLVNVWGNEADTQKNGKTDTAWFNDNWKFNNDGKITALSQYTSKD